MSMNMPMISSWMRIISITTLRSREIDRKNLAMIWGICSKVIHQVRIEAEAMIRHHAGDERGTDEHLDNVIVRPSRCHTVVVLVIIMKSTHKWPVKWP
jgi:hypothetical protein